MRRARPEHRQAVTKTGEISDATSGRITPPLTCVTALAVRLGAPVADAGEGSRDEVVESALLQT
jgi:hypothetical protein